MILNLGSDSRRIAELDAKRAAAWRTERDVITRDYSAERAESVLADKRKQRTTQWEGAVQAIRANVTRAVQQEADARPAAAQFRTAMTTEGALKAAAMRAMVQGAPLSMLRTAAQSADAAQAHAIRTELASRSAPATREDAAQHRAVVEALDAKHAELHGQSIADLIGAQTVLAMVETRGPDDDFLQIDPVRTLSAFRAAWSYRNAQGELVTIREDDAMTLAAQVGAVASREPDAPTQTIALDRLAQWRMQGLFTDQAAVATEAAAFAGSAA